MSVSLLYRVDKFSFILRKPACFDETTFMNYSHVFEFNIDICLQHSPKAAVWARKWNQMKPILTKSGTTRSVQSQTWQQNTSATIKSIKEKYGAISRQETLYCRVYPLNEMTDSSLFFLGGLWRSLAVMVAEGFLTLSAFFHSYFFPT